MDLLVFLTLAAACFAVLSGHAVESHSQAEAHWKAKLGNTPMPKAIIDSLKESPGTNGEGTKLDAQGIEAIDVDKRASRQFQPIFYSRGTTGEGTKMDAQGIEAIDVDKRASRQFQPIFYSQGATGEGIKMDAQGIEAIDVDKRAARQFQPIFYSRGTTASVTSPVGSGIFFFDHHLTHPGEKLKLQFSRGCKSKFLPFKVAKSIPFSSDKLPEILGLFSVRPNSPQAKVIEDTIAGCEDRAVAVEDNKYCATSLETLVDYAVSNIGSQVKVLSTTIDKDITMEYTVEKAQKVSSDGNFVCHKLIYPYAVFYCHRVRDTDAYVVSLVDANGQKSKGAAVCHRNTSSWHPDHAAFHALHVKPGTVPVCHFVGADDMIWTWDKNGTGYLGSAAIIWSNVVENA